MRRIILKIFPLLILFFVASCSGYDSRVFASYEDMVKSAKEEVRWIAAGDFKKVMESGDNYYLVDCREQVEFDSSCIMGAIPVPRGVLESEIASKAPRHRTPLYIYCSNGDRSALAAKVLPLLKYSNVRVIEGGFDNWKSSYPDLVENNPVRGAVKAAPKKASGGCGG